MRLIDADFLESELIKWRDNDTHRKSRSLVERWVRKEGINVLMRVVNVFPSMPYEPVKHGRWENNPHAYGFERCSVCHDCNIWGGWADGKKWNFCPHCGAKMDGGDTVD